MKVYEKVKAFIEENAQYWFMVAAIFIVFEIANYGFLSIVAPMWVCTCVSIVLTIMMTLYVSIVYKHTRKKYTNYSMKLNGILLDRVDALEIYFNGLNDKN